MSDCLDALAKLVLRKMHIKTNLMKLKFSARKAVHDCYQCSKFELKISSDSGDMHFSAIKPRWGGCSPLKSFHNSSTKWCLVFGRKLRISHWIGVVRLLDENWGLVSVQGCFRSGQCWLTGADFCPQSCMEVGRCRSISFFFFYCRVAH